MCSFPKAFGTGRDFVLNKKCDKLFFNAHEGAFTPFRHNFG